MMTGTIHTPEHPTRFRNPHQSEIPGILMTQGIARQIA
jgi:hypothetical protein